MKKKTTLLLAAILTISQISMGQVGPESDEMEYAQWGIKTNLLYFTHATLNLGLEFRMGDNTSFDLPFAYNPWTFANNKKWKHISVQPEFRWWLHETFKGHFFGLHGHYAFYNVGSLRQPPFSEYMNTHRFEGWLAGAGLSYGYRWNFNSRWGLEATVGAGYAYLSYDKFRCGDCEQLLGPETKNYFGPTKAGISLVYNLGVKRRPYKTVISYVQPRETPPQPRLTIYFIKPEVEDVKERSSEIGKAYLDFVVARAEILPNFRNNAEELNRINHLIQQVLTDPDATITSINITGYASPEASYSSNLTLSQRRATSFKEYFRKMYNLSDNLFTAWGAGEDWATLETLVSESSLPDKFRLLEIIRGKDDWDAREKRFLTLSGGATYRKLMDEMYPKLRRVECQVHYTVVPFTIEKGKEVLRTRPSNLSLNEMFLIANTYKMGSDEYKEVFETAARIFPQSDIANLNAAASALTRKDVAEATRYLNRVKEQSIYYWNNLGMLMWFKRDREKAAECFAKAGSLGARNLKEISGTK